MTSATTALLAAVFRLQEPRRTASLLIIRTFMLPGLMTSFDTVIISPLMSINFGFQSTQLGARLIALDELERDKKGEDEEESQAGKLQNHCDRTTDDEAEGSEGATQKVYLSLECICVNARSIVNKMDYLRAEVKVFDPDIIGITESWTDDKISDVDIQIEGFEMFRQDRLVSKGVGVLLYIRDFSSKCY